MDPDHDAVTFCLGILSNKLTVLRKGHIGLDLLSECVHIAVGVKPRPILVNS